MLQTSATYQGSAAGQPTLQEVLVALSFALDLTEGAVPGHAIRCCLLALRIAHTVGLDQASISDLYYAALLKDVGCSSNSARMCQIVGGGDDRAAKAAARLEDWTRPHTFKFQTIRFLWDEVLPGATALQKGAHLVKMGLGQHRNNKELLTLRCDRGAQIIRKLGLDDSIAIAVRHLDEHWDGKGYPSSLRGREIPVLSRILCLAQHLDAFCMELGPQAAIDAMKQRAGRWFDPKLVRTVLTLDTSRVLWRDCLPGDSVEQARATVLRLKPGGEELSPAGIDSICAAFADVVDAKSPFTFRHSVGVMQAAVAIGNILGLSANRISTLRRAALLHDVGKLGVSNSILDKPTRLTGVEFSQVKSHPGLGHSILSRVAAFDEIAILASEHHERLDGTGYPANLTALDLSLESRILAVADTYAALSEHRPYREGLSRVAVTGIMDPLVPGKLDRDCYAALHIVMDDLTPIPPPAPGQCIVPNEELILTGNEVFI